MLSRILRWLPVRSAWSCVLLGLGFASCGGPEGATGGLEPAPAKGSLSVAVTGLPGGVSALVRVTGPVGFTRTLTASESLHGLTPGSYSVSADSVTAAGHLWAPSPSAQDVSVAANAEAPASVQYMIVTGSLSIVVKGLPAGMAAALTLSGPEGFSKNIPATTALNDLDPGVYTLSAAPVTSSGSTWSPALGSQSLTVNAGGSISAEVSYSGGGAPGSLNLRIDGLYVTQAAQRYDGSTPLVAGRDGFLRVFVLANEVNSAEPAVRVRLYAAGTLLQTWMLNAPGAGVPLSVNEGSLTASWNLLVPAALMRPGLTILADVDPAGVLAEADESDNTFPASGTPGPVDVRALPSWNVRFVPVLQSANGLQGDVTAAKVPSFLSTLRALLPVADYDADVRTAYTSTAPALTSDNANGAWGTVLSEVLALKAADASDRYYYGVVKTSYTSGVAGIGYVGGGAHTAIGWDRPSSAPGVMAHEVGHNMGRSHASCGGAGGPDPSYPYAGGSIGIWGVDVRTLELKDPATYYDLMGYCNPDWVSDFNWSAMISYREGGPLNTASRSVGQSVGQGLLIWGRITPAGLVLEPAFVVENARFQAPPAGSHRIEAFDASGRELFSIPFGASESADLPTGREEAFAFVVPADRALATTIAELRLVSGGRTVSRKSGVPATPAPRFTRGADGRGVLEWDSSLHPVVMVRDATSGQILSFARGGSVRLPRTVGRVDATFSDGARSARVFLNRQ